MASFIISRVSLLRAFHTKHGVLDVIAGAGVGIISAKWSALFFEKKCNRRQLDKRFGYSVFN